MVWVNKECVNRPTQEGMIGGGAMCVCPKCIAERRKQNPPKVCERGELERKCVHCENDKLEAELNDTIAVYGEQLRRAKEENQRLRDEVERWKQVAEDAAVAKTKVEACEIVTKALEEVSDESR